MTRAVARVMEAPFLVLAVIAVHFALAGWVGSSVRAAVGASMGPYTVLADGHLFYSVLELLFFHPGLGAGAAQLLTGSAVISMLAWTLLSPAVIRRLKGPIPSPMLAAETVRSLPGVAVVTLWHLLPRAVLLGFAAAVTSRLMGAGAWGLAGILMTFVVLAYCTCALDIARCNLVLHGAPPLHPATALGGYLQAARRPAVLMPSILLGLLQWACVAGIVVAALAGLGSEQAIWLARGLAVLGILFGLTRIAVAVGARSPS